MVDGLSSGVNISVPLPFSCRTLSLWSAVSRYEHWGCALIQQCFKAGVDADNSLLNYVSLMGVGESC